MLPVIFAVPPGLARRVLRCVVVLIIAFQAAHAQTAPTPLTLPFSTDFGTSGFAVAPAGFAAWGGLSGGAISSAATAALSVSSTTALITSATTVQTGGGCYGFATGGNARFYIQTSSNTSNGANQLAMALDTTGRLNITLSYDVEVISAQSREVGVLSQYRIGTSGSWTTLAATSGSNPFSQAGGTTGVKTSPVIALPPDAENQSVVQIRWATWRGSGSGNSSGVAIDNVSVGGDLATSALSISLDPASVAENSATPAGLTVTRTGSTENALPVTLVIDDPAKLAYSGSNPFLIPAGADRVTVELQPVDDNVFDGDQPVLLTVTAPAAFQAEAELLVIDNEDVFSPAANYYAAAEGLSGGAMKAALKTIATPPGIVALTYNGVLNALKVLDEDPMNSANVLTVYSGSSILKNEVYSPGIRPADTSWSREHVWPASFGLDPTDVNPGETGGDAGPDFTDLFNLRPCIQTVNNQRSNRYFDVSFEPATIPPLAPECSYNTETWAPRVSERGDLARTIFYMVTRYDGTDANTLDLEIANLPTMESGIFANLSTLLRWHMEDPVSPEERRRNHLIFTNYQNNRNPFIDRPEFVAQVWGTITQSENALALEEGGGAVVYTVQLESAPTADVVISATASQSGQLSIFPSSLTFTGSNWDQPQTVTVSAVDDSIYEESIFLEIQHAITTSDVRYAQLEMENVEVDLADDDPLFSQTSLPIAFGGSWTSLPTGFTGVSIGSYPSELGGDASDGSARFDASGDRLIVGFNSSPASLTYNVKGNPADGTATSGTFVVQTSADGLSFTTIRTIINKNNADVPFTEALSSTVRYVAFLYSDKIGGNIQLDRIRITKLGGFAGWAAEQGLAGPRAAVDADDDGDHRVNLVEFAAGGSPFVNDSAQAVAQSEMVGGRLRLTGVVRINDPGLIVEAQTTEDLGNPASWTTTGVTKITPVDQTGVPPGFERMVFERNDGAAKAWMRFRFSILP